MEINGMIGIFMAGCFGGALNELLHWWHLRQKPNLPAYAKSPLYWIITIAMALSGGAVAVFYFGEQGNSMVILHVGIATPLLLQKFSTVLPEAEGARAASASVRDFFRW